jgi:hypothetical protein
MMDINRIRAVVGALIPLLSFAFIGSGIIINDWYSGEAVRGTEGEIGWWNATVDYGAFNGTIWVGENDNLFGVPEYERYVMNHSGSDSINVMGPIMGHLITMVLCLITLVFGLLTATRITGWRLPTVICASACVIALFSTALMYSGFPDIVRSDLDELKPVIEDAIPEDEMHMLENNLTHGESFTWIFIGIPGLLISPLLFIGIKRQKLPPESKIADNFFVNGSEEPIVRSEKKKLITEPEEGVQGGSLEIDEN